MRLTGLVLLLAACRSGDVDPSVPLPEGTVHLLVSGHAYEVLLVDAQGETLHQWSVDPAAHGVITDRGSFRRAWLQPDGGLLALIEYGSLWRLSIDSEVLWVVDDGNHHDIAVGPDALYSLTDADTLSTYSLAGQHQSDLPLIDIVQASEFSALQDAMATDGDPLHLNSLFLRDRTLLISSRATSHLMVLDLDQQALTFASGGEFFGQHDAQFLPDGHVLLLDNGTRTTGSRPLELTFPALQPVWSGDATGAFTSCCGTVQRLSDGHTLWTATTAGAAFEHDADGQLVWTFRTPFLDPSGQPFKLFDLHRLDRTELPDSLR
jgi:hypothetical protein